MIQLLMFVTGAIFGSAANALIDRLPGGQSWIKGRSKCDSCGHILSWRDLIPVWSYFELWANKFAAAKPKNKNQKQLKVWEAGCRYCHSPIPFRNPAVELFLGIGFVLIFQTIRIFPEQILLAGILWVTTIVAVMDWETKLVSELMVGVWGVLAVILTFVSMGMVQNPGILMQNLSGNVIGMIAGVVVIGGIWAASRGRAMGAGDVEIAAVMGWWLGWQNVLAALWVGFVSGAAMGLIKVAKKEAKLKSEMAFGPFLIVGAWAAYVWGDKIWRLWMP